MLPVFMKVIFQPVNDTALCCPAAVFIQGVLFSLVLVSCFTMFCVDCAVGPWSEFGDCSATCGGGIRTRERVVLQQPSGIGRQCPVLSEIEACNEQECSKWLSERSILIET